MTQVYWNTIVCTGNTIAKDSTLFIKCVLDPNAVAKSLFLQFFPQFCEPNLLVFYEIHTSQPCHLVGGRIDNCLSDFSVAMIKYCDKNNLREKRYVLTHSSRVQSIMAKKSRWWGLEAAGHITATTRKPDNNECLSRELSWLLLRWVFPHKLT